MVDDQGAASCCPGCIQYDVVRMWLAREVERILDCGPADGESDFFDLGGDSLSAVTLFAAIAARFGVALPLVAIYEAPVLNRLAERIAEAGSRSGGSCLVPIKPGDGASAVILLHAIGGHVFDLLRLGGLIETTGSVAAIRAFGLEPGETPLDRVEAMADAYADIIRAAYPRATIHLVGYSFGGLVAIEVARRLRDAGIAVGLVALLDTYPAPRYWPRLQMLAVRARRVKNQVGVLYRADGPARVAYLRERLFGAGAKPDATVARRQWLALPAAAPSEILLVFEGAFAAINRYRPAGFELPVTFLAPAKPSVFLPTRPRAVWSRVLPRLSIVAAPGDHATMVDEHGAWLAAKLSRLVAECP